jgi:DNA-binding protein HU-beta
MRKIDLVRTIAKQAGCLQKDANLLVDSFLSIIIRELSEGSKVILTGFGTFSVMETKSKMGRNPQTGERIRIPESKKIKFSAGNALKKKIKGELV